MCSNKILVEFKWTNKTFIQEKKGEEKRQNKNKNVYTGKYEINFGLKVNTRIVFGWKVN